MKEIILLNKIEISHKKKNFESHIYIPNFYNKKNHFLKNLIHSKKLPGYIILKNTLLLRNTNQINSQLNLEEIK